MMIMMTAGSVLNVEPHYNHMYQHNNVQPKLDSPKSSTSLGCNMAYRFKSTTGRLSPPPLYRNAGVNNKHKMEIVESIDRLSPSREDQKTSFKDIQSSLIKENYMPGAVTFHPAARGRFGLDQFSLDALHMTSQQRAAGQLSQAITDFTSSKPSELNRSDGKKLSTSNLALHNASFFDNDDDDSWKVCGVCNDKATGYHFNALTCEGCKGFFRRSVKNGKSFTCSYSNQCSITKSNRRQCQACRLRKCIQIGMKRECIMSKDQIQLKKTLVLSNRIKRTAQAWLPTEMNDDQKHLLDVICTAFVQSNNPPDKKDLRGGEEVKQDSSQSPCSSPSSSNSSNFLDLIKRISSEIAARTPSNMTNAAHVLHFTDIMEYSIKEVIKFCKKIPTFMDLDLKDQIALLKAGCTEILFLKANYTYDIEKKALTLGPDILYTRESFLQGGMSDEYTDAYLKFHEDLGLLQLDDKEMASLSAIALFSADRTDVRDHGKIEAQQEVIACALQAYTENEWRIRNRFANIMGFLPRLRTLNALCTHAFSQVQKTYGDDIRPLVLEVQPDDEEGEEKVAT